MTEILNEIEKNPMLYISIIMVIVEFFLRLKPTEKNLSILDALHRILNLIIPNLKSEKKQERFRTGAQKIETFKEKFKIK